jgi:N-acetylneuraminic acid mutarotase
MTRIKSIGVGVFVVAWIFVSGCAQEPASTASEVETVDEWPGLPSPVSNNAVASVDIGGTTYLLSFNGLGPGKTWSDVGSSAFQYEVGGNSWTTLDDVPGGEGRLATVAVGLGDGVYIFGGYTVAQDGTEKSAPWVHKYDPVTRSFEELSPIPVPVDDSVSLLYKDRYIYLVSGWHDTDNVNLVQVYDTESDLWFEASPYPGPAVFGHAGGIVENRIVIADGTRVVAGETDRRFRFAISDACYIGLIDDEDPSLIEWKPLPAHPGAPLYRLASTGTTLGDDRRVVFAGGSDNPYNYDGIGYNGELSEPSSQIFAYNLDSDSWEELGALYVATMDHRGLLQVGGELVILGGMLAGQEVTDRLGRFTLE